MEERHKEEVHAAREAIKAGADLCLKKFQQLMKTQKSDTPSFGTEFQAVLRIIGQTLFNATAPLLKEEWERREFSFYYWPGYESVLTDDPSDKRITLMWKESPDGEIRCGAGYRLTADSVEVNYPESGSSLWFERALSVCNQSEPHESFIPGGTHGWISQDNLLLDTEAGREFLTALEVQVSDRNECEIRRGIVHIQLDPNDRAHWGTIVARYLNDRDLIICNNDWPVPIEDLSESNIQRDQYIRRKLYNIWLAASFDINWRGAWFEVFLKQLERKGLARLSERLQKDAQEREYSKTPSYRWWYTLPLDNSVDNKGKLQPLGSAMFLSSSRLPPIFLYIAASFISRIYFQMRDLERATKIAQEAGFEGQKRQASVFAHQTAGLITVPWNDPGRLMLAEESQFLLWMAVTLLTKIWGTAKFDPREPVSADTQFQRWKTSEPKNVLNKVISFSLLQGLQRASKAPKPNEDPAAWRLNWKAAKRAVEVLQQGDRIEFLRKTLGFALPTDPVRQWMIYQGFILCFHHSLWQATNHAFKASLETNHERYLWLEWDDASITIWNRSALKTPSNTRSSDRDFLDFLERRLNSVFVIDGPSDASDTQTGVDRIWRTTITYEGE
jgi:hypothetical protein